jgi:hypothetical protein
LFQRKLLSPLNRIGEPPAALGAFFDLAPLPLVADIVAKVENRTTPKISRKQIFKHLYRCNAL